jgi:PKD repeat protein
MFLGMASVAMLGARAEEEAGSRAVTLSASTTRGPSTVDSSYLVPVAAKVRCISILTVGESVNNRAYANVNDVAGATYPAGAPYRLAGIPDGIGQFDNGDGTITVLVNHEINPSNNPAAPYGTGSSSSSYAGVPRRHHTLAGGKGGFISKWIINSSTLAVTEGADLIRILNVWDRATQAHRAPTTAAEENLVRLCSADLAAKTAMRNSAATPATGTSARIFFSGEETDGGRAFAHIVTGTTGGGVSYEIPRMGKLNFENVVACPKEQEKTIIVGLDDGAFPPAGGWLVVYVGTKSSASGTDFFKAGLSAGTLYGVKVGSVTAEDRSTNIGLAKGGSTAFTLAALPDQSLAGAATTTALASAGCTGFLRPEDGCWDPSNPADFYFVTTDRFDTATKSATETQVAAGQAGRSRLWRLRFTNIAAPESGGTIAMLLDGAEAQQMMDNLVVDKNGNILIQEDAGKVDHLGRILEYNIATGALTVLAQHDPVRFQTGGASFTTTDEESSGICDASDTLGSGWFLLDVQAHASISSNGNTAQERAELVERGQLVAFFNPGSVATPTVSSSQKASASPSSPNVGQEVTFTVTGTTTSGGTLSFEWDYGDGSAKVTGASVKKTYTALGAYTVTATGTDSLTGKTVVSTLTVVVKDTVRSGKIVAKLNFREATGHDFLTLTGTMPLPAGFDPTGKTLSVNIGGFVQEHTLDANGYGSAGNNSVFKIFIKKLPDTVASSAFKFFLKIQNASIQASLADEGLISKDAQRESKSIKVVMSLSGTGTNGDVTTPYDATVAVSYTAKLGAFGRCK